MWFEQEIAELVFCVSIVVSWWLIIDFPTRPTPKLFVFLAVLYSLSTPLIVYCGYGQFCFGHICGVGQIAILFLALIVMKRQLLAPYHLYPIRAYLVIVMVISCWFSSYWSPPPILFQYGICFGYFCVTTCLAVYFVDREVIGLTRKGAIGRAIGIGIYLAFRAYVTFTFPSGVALIPTTIGVVCYQSLDTMIGLITGWFRSMPIGPPPADNPILPNIPVVARLRSLSCWARQHKKFFGCIVHDKERHLDPMNPYHSLVHVIEQCEYDDVYWVFTVWEWSRFTSEQCLLHEFYLPKFTDDLNPDRRQPYTDAFESNGVVSIFVHCNDMIVNSYVHIFDLQLKSAMTFELSSSIRRATLSEGHTIFAFKFCAAICQNRWIGWKCGEKAVIGWRFRLIASYIDRSPLPQFAPVLAEYVCDFYADGTMKIKVDRDITTSRTFLPIGRIRVHRVNSSTAYGLMHFFVDHNWNICFMYDFKQNRFAVYPNTFQINPDESDHALTIFSRRVQFFLEGCLHPHILTTREAFYVCSNGMIQYMKIPIAPPTLRFLTTQAIYDASGGRTSNQFWRNEAGNDFGSDFLAAFPIID